MKALLTILALALVVAASAAETFTDRVLTKVEIDHAWLAATGLAFGPAVSVTTRHAEIRQAALVGAAEKTRATINRSYGLTKWNDRFDCVAYALAFSLELRGRLAREFFQSSSGVTRPAAFLVAYHPDPKTSATHCVVFVLTDGGAVFVDPQKPDPVVTLTSAQKATLFFFIP